MTAYADVTASTRLKVTTEMFVDELMDFYANDFGVPVRDMLERITRNDEGDFFAAQPPAIVRGGTHNRYPRHTAEYIQDLVDILEKSETWPFKPIRAQRDGSYGLPGTLYDGHHRTMAAIMAGWDKPIPATSEQTWMWS